MGEVIDKIKNNLNEFWSGLEKNQKITIIIIAVLSMLLIIGVAFISAMPKYHILYSNLDAKDAGQIRDKLKEMKVPVKVDGTTILVPKDNIDEARIMLAMEGLPANDFTFPDMLKSSFNETTEDKKHKYLIYMQKSIANGIKSLNGIEWAQVNLFIPDDNVFVLESNKLDASASIIIKMKPGVLPLDSVQVNGIVQYVSKSVKGLKPDNISIIDDTGRSLKAEEGSINAQVNKQLDIQEATRLSIQNSVKKFLESVFGINNVNVMATVKLNFDSKVENKKEFFPEDKESNTGVVRNKEEIEKSWENADTGGVPGTDSNIEEIPNYPEIDNSKSKYEESSKIFNYEINETQTQLIKEQGYIDDFSLSVLIDSNYKIKQEAERRKQQKEYEKEYKNKTYSEIIEKIKQEGGFEITDEEIGKAEELVIMAIKGLIKDLEGAEKKIIVDAMDFDNSLKDQIESAQKKEAEENRNQAIKTALFALAALLVLAIPGIILLIKRRRYEDQSEAEAAISAITESSEVSDIELDDKNEVKKKIEKFVAQKPEQVAQLLKTWLNEE